MVKKKESCPTCDIVLDEECNEENNYQPCKNSAAISVANMLCKDSGKDKHKCDILFEQVTDDNKPIEIGKYLDEVGKLLPRKEKPALEEVKKLWQS